MELTEVLEVANFRFLANFRCLALYVSIQSDLFIKYFRQSLPVSLICISLSVCTKLHLLFYDVLIIKLTSSSENNHSTLLIKSSTERSQKLFR